MKMDLSRGSWLAFIILITLLWSGGTATETSAKDFSWPMFNAAFTTPKNLGVGSITLHLKNDVIPHFDESASAECELKNSTLLVCGMATLHYDATEDNGAVKIRRNGSINFMPVGTCTQTTCIVEHQASVEETQTLWYWTGTYWKLASNESISSDWDDTLRFDLQQSTSPGGSTVGVSTSTGSAFWTLYLPGIR